MGCRRLTFAVAALLAAPAAAAAQTPPAGFADWTAVTPGSSATGTLLGQPITLTGNIDGAPNSVVDGSSTLFSSATFTPSLPLSDVIELGARDANPGFTLTFGAPVLDPVLHVQSLFSSIGFPGGTRIVRVSGEPEFTVLDNHVQYGNISPVAGTAQILGTYSSLRFDVTITNAFFDDIRVQVGGTLAPVAPPVTTPPPPVPTPTAPPAPIAGVRLIAQATTGTVLVSAAGSKSFAPLTPGAAVPVGSLVDARKGSVDLQSLVGGAIQTAKIAAGLFQIRQKGSSAPDLVLATPPGKARACAGKTKGVVRTLSVSVAKGILRTIPMKGIVTGRDAAWTTTDRCDGTLTKVVRGRVFVRLGNRNVLVRPGRSYLIKARLFGARRNG